MTKTPKQQGCGECHLCGVTWTGDDNTEEAAHCDALRKANQRITELERERDEARADLAEMAALVNRVAELESKDTP